MSLSERFPLFDLPLLPLEQVLSPLNAKELLLFALSSEKARQLLRMLSLVKYFDIDVKPFGVIFTICFKSEELIRWKFNMKLPVNASERSRRWALFELGDGRKRTAHVFKLDGMRMVLFETIFGYPYDEMRGSLPLELFLEYPDEMRCRLPKEHFVDYTRRIGHLFQSICPGQRIRKLGAGKVGWDDEQVFFHMNGITSCDDFLFDMYDQVNFLEILEKTDVKKNIFLKCNRKVDSNLEWMNNEKIRNISRLHLTIRYLRNLDCSQFLELENEHSQLIGCRLNGSDLNEFLKKWMNGEFTKRRTLAVKSCSSHGFDDKVLNGLTQEPVETWEKLGKPGLVLFFDQLCLNPTPRKVPDDYETVLLKNCHGQFATVVQTRGDFYFFRWDLPLSPFNIPEGHKLLVPYPDCPVSWIESTSG